MKGNKMNRSEILQQAEKMVCGHREQDYGTPENNFDIIAQLWSAYSGHAFSSVDVAMMMALLKIARIKSGKMTEDSFVDLAGYAACGGEIATKTKPVERVKVTDKDVSVVLLRNEEIKPGGSENEN
jgi:hypothetical protein